YLPSKKTGALNLQGLAADLSEEINLGREALSETLHDAVREQAAIHLAENLPLKAMFKLSEIKTIYPGVDLIVESQRHYPRGAFASHLLGYLGKLDRPAWLSLRNSGYRLDSRVGRAGMEKLFERELRGVDGEIRMEVDAQGHIKRILDQVPWKAGGNVTLNLDARLQSVAEDALRASPSGRGAVVAMDPRNGEVLAFTSIPDFDPNLFLQGDKDGVRMPAAKVPEFNLAISGTYPPGSTFKIVTSAALLNEGKMSPQERTYCPGSYTVGNRVFRCWEKKGHGYQDWLGAIAHSCDVYFYHAGLRVGGELLERYERMFRIGEETHIALTGEKRGNRFGPQMRSARGKSWYDGDSANLAIGQGELLVTPIQMAVLISAVANRGTLWRPHFTRRIEYAEGGAYDQKPEALGQITLKPQTWDLLHLGLHRVVEAGTGGGVRVPGVAVAGKTGTAENPHGEDHAWFVSFAGKAGEEPTLALSVLVQHGGHGSSAAGPVARKIIEAAFAPAAPAGAVVPDEPRENRPAEQQ
ncbi:MAG: penicillin-binding protein 2, partial [Elusimicrobiota bacterium]